MREGQEKWLISYLRGVSVLLGDAAILMLFFYVVEAIMPGHAFSVAAAVWCLYLGILFLADDLLARFGVSMNFYLFFNGAVILAGSFLVVRGSACVPYENSFFAYLGAGAAATGIHGAVCGYRLPGADRILRYVDVLIVVTGFYLYAVFESGRGIHREAMGLGLAVMVLDLMVVNRLRTGDEAHFVIRGTGMGSRLILAGMFGVSLMATTILVGAASGQVHSAVDVFLLIMGYALQVLEAFFTVVGWILAKIILLFLWFSPTVSQGTRENIGENLGFATQEIAGEGTGIFFWVFAFGGILALVLVLAWVFYQLRHVRVERRRTVFRKSRAVRKSYFWKELLALGKKAREWVVFEGNYCLYRNTPEGVYVFAERLGRRKRIRRRKAEAPGEYMRRLAVLLEEKRQKEAKTGVLGDREGEAKGKERNELYDLADKLDRIFYGRNEGENGSRMTEGECRSCRERIRRACQG